MVSVNSVHRSLVGLIGSGMLVLVVGCGDGGPELVDAQGVVTLDGKPVPNASVTFSPNGGVGSPAYGVTDATGHYTLNFTRDRSGVMPGNHDVMIKTEKVNPEDLAEGEPIPEFVPLPRKYSQPGELAADVTAEKEEYNFDLTSR